MNPTPDPAAANASMQPVRYDDTDNAVSDLSREDFIETRRELARWKAIAAEYESRLSTIESSASWRYSAPIRLLAEILPRWRALTLLGIIAIVSLPLWPLLLVLCLMKPGRDFLWSSLSRIGSAGQLLQDIYARLFAGSAATPPETARAVYVFKRPCEMHEEPTSTTRATDNTHLLTQLSPQNLAVFSALAGDSQVITAINDLEEIVSYSSSEKRLMMLYAEPPHSEGMPS